MSAVTDILTHATVWLDGRSFIGEAETVTLPKLNVKKSEYNAGGLSASVDVPMAQFEKLEATFDFKTLNREHLNTLGVTLSNQVNVSARASIHGIDGSQKPVKAAMRGFITSIDYGDWKTGDGATAKLMLSPHYYRLEINNAVVHEIDALNCIAIVAGLDQLATTRAHLGG